jgi:hypothetical protein
MEVTEIIRLVALSLGIIGIILAVISLAYSYRRRPWSNLEQTVKQLRARYEKYVRKEG